MPRYALSEGVRKDMPTSGLHLIPRAQKGDIQVPAYNGWEEKSSALNFLTLWSLWAIQFGFSPDLTKQLLQDYVKTRFHLPSLQLHKTWESFIDGYFKNHRIAGAEDFELWYRETVKKANIVITWYSYGELERATESFSSHNWVGQGSVGDVFRGRLPNDEVVAVKKLKGVRVDSLKKLLGEVDLYRDIGHDSHPNVVHLKGYCTNIKNPLLVLEFMNAGNLRHHLEGVYGEYLVHHPRTRLSIAIDVANALVQLHSKGPCPIYHRDVRSTNVLLDSDWNAKLNDLGLAVRIKNESDKHTSPISYSRGYTDPVYEHTGVLDEKTDVYGFGVVLMELVTHLKVWDSSRRPERSLADLVTSRAKSGNPCALIRRPRKVDGQSFGMLETMLQVAVWCCDLEMEKRPTISQVAEYLEEFRSHGSRRKWAADKDRELVGDQRGTVGWQWNQLPSPIIGNR